MSDTTEKQQTLVEKQVELEKLFSKNQLIPRIRAEFLNPEYGIVAHLEECEIPMNFGLDLLVQMALHKRATLPTLVGILYHHMGDAQSTADMLVKAAKADLVDWDPEFRKFIVRLTISQDVQDELDRFQFPLPMVVEPRELTSNRSSAYFTAAGSCILRNNHHEDDICLDHLNRLNKIKLTINMDVVKFVKNRWKSLDKPKPGEEREKYEERKRAFKKYDRTAKDVIATLMEHSDHFYLTHKYDKRGRTYCMGYHVSYQAAPWNKACIEFAEKELVE